MVYMYTGAMLIYSMSFVVKHFLPSKFIKSPSLSFSFICQIFFFVAQFKMKEIVKVIVKYCTGLHLSNFNVDYSISRLTGENGCQIILT